MIKFTHNNGQYLNFDGAELYYETLGNSNGVTLVFLHGGFGCMLDFNTIIDSIPSDYKIIGIDFRGHGKSTLGHKKLSYAQYQRDIKAVLNHLDILSYSLLGFSDGGIVSYRLAASESANVKQLITLGSQWRLKEADPAIEFLGSVTSDDWNEMFPDAVASYNQSNPQPDFDLLVNKVKSVWLDTAPTGYPNNSVSAIKCPTLIIRGDGDFLFSLREAAVLLEEIENSTFMNIPFAEHEVHKEYPEICSSVINKFLSET